MMCHHFKENTTLNSIQPLLKIRSHHITYLPHSSDSVLTFLTI